MIPKEGVETSELASPLDQGSPSRRVIPKEGVETNSMGIIPQHPRHQVIPKEGVETPANTPPIRPPKKVIPKEGVETRVSTQVHGLRYRLDVIPKEGVESITAAIRGRNNPGDPERGS